MIKVSSLSSASEVADLADRAATTAADAPPAGLLPIADRGEAADEAADLGVAAADAVERGVVDDLGAAPGEAARGVTRGGDWSPVWLLGLSMTRGSLREVTTAGGGSGGAAAGTWKYWRVQPRLA